MMAAGDEIGIELRRKVVDVDSAEIAGCIAGVSVVAGISARMETGGRNGTIREEEEEEELDGEDGGDEEDAVAERKMEMEVKRGGEFTGKRMVRGISPGGRRIGPRKHRGGDGISDRGFGVGFIWSGREEVGIEVGLWN